MNNKVVVLKPYTVCCRQEYYDESQFHACDG